MLRTARVALRYVTPVHCVALIVVVCGAVLIGCSPQPKPPAADAPPAPGEQPDGLPPVSPDEAWFEDITATTGIQAIYRNGREAEQYTLLETVGGGVAMIDFDGDGWPDLFFPQGGRIAPGETASITGLPGRLYRNQGELRFLDVSDVAGIRSDSLYTHAAITLDFNCDGWPDLFVTGYGGQQLWRNNGDGTFDDVTRQAGLETSGWPTAAAAADMDKDGFPDLFVTHYCRWNPADERGLFCGERARGVRDSCPPQLFPPAQDQLYRNRGDGTFEPIAAAAGISDQGRGLGVVAGGITGSGWNDWYVANDAGANHLYRGGPDLPLPEVGLVSGVTGNEYGLPEGSMGVDLGDYNGDGLPDLFVTNFELENNSLYHNEGGGLFRHVTVEAGLAGECFPYVGFGTGFADMNGNGWEDLLVVNGSVFYKTGQSPYRQPAFLYENAGGRFRDVRHQGGPFFSQVHAGRGAAVGDLDNDGALDWVIVRQNEAAVVLRGRKPPTRWATVQLRGVVGDPQAVGAQVSAEFQGRRIVRWVRSGAGYLSQFDMRIVLPRDEADNRPVEVRWRSGHVETFAIRDFVVNQLIEGQGIAKTADPTRP